jgi:hypothetical protein
MEEELISYKTSKLAKKVGFDIEVFSYYTNTEELEENACISIGDECTPAALWKVNYNSIADIKSIMGMLPHITYHNDIITLFSAPPRSLLQKWLREVYKLFIKVDWYADGKLFDFEISEISDHSDRCIYIKGTDPDIYEEGFNSYEEASEEGLYQALLLIQKENGKS